MNENMQKYLDKAQVLIEALPYIQRFNRKIIENGTAADYSEEKATEILSQPEVTAIADIKEGNEEAAAWGCDLTHGYIEINADYRS